MHDKPLAPLLIVGSLLVVAILVGVVTSLSAPTPDTSVLGASDAPRGMVQPIPVEQILNR